MREQLHVHCSIIFLLVILFFTGWVIWLIAFNQIQSSPVIKPIALIQSQTTPKQPEPSVNNKPKIVKIETKPNRQEIKSALVWDKDAEMQMKTQLQSELRKALKQEIQTLQEQLKQTLLEKEAADQEILATFKKEIVQEVKSTLENAIDNEVKMQIETTVVPIFDQLSNDSEAEAEVKTIGEKQEEEVKQELSTEEQGSELATMGTVRLFAIKDQYGSYWHEQVLWVVSEYLDEQKQDKKMIILDSQNPVNLDLPEGLYSIKLEVGAITRYLDLEIKGNQYRQESFNIPGANLKLIARETGSNDLISEQLDWFIFKKHNNKYEKQPVANSNLPVFDIILEQGDYTVILLTGHYWEEKEFTIDSNLNLQLELSPKFPIPDELDAVLENSANIDSSRYS